MPKMFFPNHSFLVFPAETAKKRGIDCQLEFLKATLLQKEFG